MLKRTIILTLFLCLAMGFWQGGQRSGTQGSDLCRTFDKCVEIL